MLTARQAQELGYSPDAIQYRTSSGRWRRLLPGVFLVSGGEPTRRQLLVSASRWAGRDALIDGPCACFWHGVRTPGFDAALVHLVVGPDSARRSTGFVRVRRALCLPDGCGTDLLQYVQLPAALVVAAAPLSDRAAAAILSEAVQREKVSVEQLVAALDHAPPRGRLKLVRIIDDLSAGIRSAPEADVRRLVTRSGILSEPLWNPWLRLPDGSQVSPDALWVSAGLVHEVNGRRYHAWGQAFESMQARHDAMTAAGLVVLHNVPRRLTTHPMTVQRQLEQCFLRHDGRGLPPGVQLIPGLHDQRRNPAF